MNIVFLLRNSISLIVIELIELDIIFKINEHFELWGDNECIYFKFQFSHQNSVMRTPIHRDN